MYIYQCIKRDEKCVPPRNIIACEKPTQREAIKWLEENGGGVFRDILSNVEFRVVAISASSKTEYHVMRIR